MKTVQFLALQAIAIAIVSFLNSPFASAQIAVKAGLQIYYPMDGNANDLSSESNDGAATSVTFGDDRRGFPGKAGNFNGATSIIRSTFPANITSDFTLAAWVYPRSFPTGSNLKSFFGIEEGIDLKINAGMSGDSVGFLFQTGGVRQPRLGRNVGQRRNTWFHYCVVRRPTLQILYINGVEERRAPSSAGSVSGVTNQWFIGGSPLLQGFGLDGFFDGLMDEFRLYNRAINQAEVDTLADNLRVGTRPLAANVPYTVSVAGREVKAAGLPDGAKMMIYSLDGRRMAKAMATAGEASASMTKPGMYMVAIESKQGLWTKRVLVQ